MSPGPMFAARFAAETFEVGGESHRTPAVLLTNESKVAYGGPRPHAFGLVRPRGSAEYEPAYFGYAPLAHPCSVPPGANVEVPISFGARELLPREYDVLVHLPDLGLRVEGAHVRLVTRLAP